MKSSKRKLPKKKPHKQTIYPNNSSIYSSNSPKQTKSSNQSTQNTSEENYSINPTKHVTRHCSFTIFNLGLALPLKIQHIFTQEKLHYINLPSQLRGDKHTARHLAVPCAHSSARDAKRVHLTAARWRGPHRAARNPCIRC